MKARTSKFPAEKTLSRFGTKPQLAAKVSAGRSVRRASGRTNRSVSPVIVGAVSSGNPFPSLSMFMGMAYEVGYGSQF